MNGWLQIVLTAITVLGSSEGLRWLLSRRALLRKQNAETTSAELSMYQQQTDWLYNRIKERDQKVDALYKELRAEQEQGL